MKVYAVFKDGSDKEIEIIPGNVTVLEAIELAKVFLKERASDVKSFEVEEDFL